MARFERTTMVLPCFSTKLAADSSMCAHCDELWGVGPDDNGFFTLDPESMSEAAAVYEAGKTVSRLMCSLGCRFLSWSRWSIRSKSRRLRRFSTV